jgi:GTP-binding protein HflX
LKKSQLKALNRLGSRNISRDDIISPEAARTMAELSFEMNRQIGLLINRSGKIEQVIIGDYHGLFIPRESVQNNTGGRLCGLRLVHTHPGGENISDDDLMDLLFLRLDLMAVLKLDQHGLPERIYSAHLMPLATDGANWQYLEPLHPANQKDSIYELIQALENEFSRIKQTGRAEEGRDRALLISVGTESRSRAEPAMRELMELARSSEIVVLDSIYQRSRTINPRFIMGRGKLSEIVIRALRLDANLLIFSRELNPSQIRSITEFTDLRVIDRTQLILDIFARRARSREGKLQVEMAQLKYMLPRLSTRDDALSRLTGGIGARGPGETKLEIDRRRINDRLARLTRELASVGSERSRRRSRRRKRTVPVISLVGYTNAGKSTLLNTLTRSEVVAEDKLFATLDPTSRRLRFPEEMEVIISDTVGFIDDLPADLLRAFQATLEELNEADLLIHVIDAANPAHTTHVEVVEKLLGELDLLAIPRIDVYNKIDLVDQSEPDSEGAVPSSAMISTSEPKSLSLDGSSIAICAHDPDSLAPLLRRAYEMLREIVPPELMAS